MAFLQCLSSSFTPPLKPKSHNGDTTPFLHGSNSLCAYLLDDSSHSEPSLRSFRMGGRKTSIVCSVGSQENAQRDGRNIYVKKDKRQAEVCIEKNTSSFCLRKCAVSLALSVGLISGIPALQSPAYASEVAGPALPDLSVLISGPPIKDPGTLLRNALPINNKAVREVQKPLEDITESLKVAGTKALDSVERNVRQTSRALAQGRSAILAGLAEPKK